MDVIFDISLIRIEGLEKVVRSKYDLNELKAKYNDNSYVVLSFNGKSYEIEENADFIYYSILKKKQTVRAKFVEDFRDEVRQQLIDNLINNKLNPMVMAIYINELQYVCNVRQGEIARTTNLTYGAISNKQRLNSLPMKIQNALIKGQLKERHGRALLTLKKLPNFNKVAEELAQKIINENLKVTEVDNLVNEILGKPIVKHESLNIKDLKKEELVNPETQIVINYVGTELEKSLKQINKFFPNLGAELEAGLDKEDYVFLLKLKGINKNG